MINVAVLGARGRMGSEVVKAVEADNELTVKALFASLPYSDMGIRYHFDKLVKTGWIELHSGDIDTRIKRVKPSEKLSKRFSLLSNQLSSTVGASVVFNTTP